jgi:hypothetical protein
MLTQDAGGTKLRQVNECHLQPYPHGLDEIRWQISLLCCEREKKQKLWLKQKKQNKKTTTTTSDATE